ncbi:MAG: preprotein translocase subunit SecE [Candidatus Bipolaricaulota bacterium]
MIERVRRYLLSVRGEAQRVSWPSRKEVITFTVLILVMTVILGAYLGALDVIFRRGIHFLLRLAGKSA